MHLVRFLNTLSVPQLINSGGIFSDPDDLPFLSSFIDFFVPVVSIPLLEMLLHIQEINHAKITKNIIPKVQNILRYYINYSSHKSNLNYKTYLKS